MLGRKKHRRVPSSSDLFILLMEAMYSFIRTEVYRFFNIDLVILLYQMLIYLSFTGSILLIGKRRWLGLFS